MRGRMCWAISLALTAVLGGGCEFVLPTDRAINHYVLSQLLLDQGKMDAALAELAEAVKADPELSVAHAAMGDIHRKRGSNELARRSYESACSSNPYAFRPHYNLGVTYQLLAEAAKVVEKLEDYLRNAVQIYLRAVTLEPEDFDTNLNLSACYFQLGKYEMAEHYCLAAVRINPKSPQAYSNLGIIYDSQSKLYEAIKAFKTSLELDTNQPHLLLNLGSTYMRQGRLKSAIQVFTIAAQEDPDSADPWEQLGSCYFHLRDLDSAMAAYNKAIQRDANSAAAHRGLGVVHMARYVMDTSKTEMRDSALKCWNTSLEIDPAQNDLVRLVKKYTPKLTGPEL
jgi:tetratricopeptide (TPR) repeat protein